jgi:hypothetical protein
MTPKPETAVPPPVISAFHEELSAASAEIAAASQELDTPIAAIERYLDTLRIHVPAWVKVKGWEDSYDNYWKRELGYDHVGDGWHIAIRETSGYLPDPDREVVRIWAFSKSPKKSRISAVDKLPELMQDIAKEAQKTARRLKEKAAEAAVFTASLGPSTGKK